MSAKAPETVNEEEKDWLRKYSEQTCEIFSAEFKENKERFPKYDALLNRFAQASAETIEKGRQHFSAIDTAHNELCIARLILKNLTRLCQY